MHEEYSFEVRDIFKNVVHEVDEENRIIKVFGVNENGSLSLISKFFMGTGKCIYENKEFNADRIYNDVVDAIADKASEYPVLLPAKLVEKMRTCANLNESAEKLGREIAEEMHALFEDYFDGDDTPFTAGNFDSRNFITATPRPGKRNPDELVLDTRDHVAVMERPGMYVWQSRYGICEDSWYGEMLFCTKNSADGTEEEFVSVPFEV